MLASARHQRRNSLLRRGFGSPPLRHLSAARLWNPINSTPRTAPPVAVRRKRSSPPPPAVPLLHSPLDGAIDPADSPGNGAGDYPLLSHSERRQSRQSISNRASLQIERSAGSEQRISLPRSVRHSYDEKCVTTEPAPEAGPSHAPPDAAAVVEQSPSDAADYGTTEQGFTGLVFQQATQRGDKGKGKAIMAPSESEGDGRGGFSQDLERGPDQRLSMASRLSGIGSAISSSNSSIMGDPDQQPDGGEEWGPHHPCYPHLNPHVPVDSHEYVNTRIIRVRRDWLLEGDLAPTFSNLYPEILDPAGVTEQEFRRIIEKLNTELVPTFNPYSWRNVVDGVLGVATGWLWEDFGLTGIKSRLRNLEKWIEQWNLDMERAIGADEGVIPPKIVPLKRTGYMTVCFKQNPAFVILLANMRKA